MTFSYTCYLIGLNSLLLVIEATFKFIVWLVADGEVWPDMDSDIHSRAAQDGPGYTVERDMHNDSRFREMIKTQLWDWHIDQYGTV